MTRFVRALAALAIGVLIAAVCVGVLTGLGAIT